jgi:hypothetical protein
MIQNRVLYENISPIKFCGRFFGVLCAHRIVKPEKNFTVTTPLNKRLTAIKT